MLSPALLALQERLKSGVPQTKQQFLKDYALILREMKRSGIKIEEAPARVRESALRLHIHALLLVWEKKQVQH